MQKIQAIHDKWQSMHSAGGQHSNWCTLLFFLGFVTGTAARMTSPAAGCDHRVGLDVRVKFGDCRSNCSRDIRGVHFVWNERTNERTNISKPIMHIRQKRLTCVSPKFKLSGAWFRLAPPTGELLDREAGKLCS